MKIIICTLRRSGSTVFWKTFRENTNFTCYDEPFNPGLSVLPKEHKKQVYSEYIALIKRDAQLFWKNYCPIAPVEENKSQLSVAQKDYLKFLLESDENVVIDTTRCWNKLESLKEVLSPYQHRFVHLHRDPIAYTSSHLLPSEVKGWRFNKKLKNEFWTKTNDYNYWKMEDVIGERIGSAFESLVMRNLNLNLSSEQFYESPAHVKLRCFSNIANAKMHREGKNLFADQFISIGFESFCKNPHLFFNQINESTGIQAEKMDFSHINSPSLGFRVDDSRWNCEFSKKIQQWSKKN